MIKSITICEVATYDEVGELLKKSLEKLNEMNYRILNVFETKVNKIPSCKTDQGFIVVYDDKLPSAQPKTGKWVYHSDWEADGECGYECSECGMGSDVDYNYCMRCGARMKEGD